jgi:hypothetical protein
MGRVIAALAAACVSAAAGAAAGPEEIERIRSRLDAHPVVRAEFVQTRRIAALTKPLVTRGQLLVSRKDGVAWRIEQPYRVTYVLKQDVTIEIAADGTRTLRSAREAPAAARTSRIVRALVGGEPGALGNWFEVEASVSGAQWKIALTPKQSQFSQFLKAVRLGGAEFVEEVAIDEANGDATRIEFRGHRAGALSDEERRVFTAD